MNDQEGYCTVCGAPPDSDEEIVCQACLARRAAAVRTFQLESRLRELRGLYRLLLGNTRPMTPTEVMLMEDIREVLGEGKLEGR